MGRPADRYNAVAMTLHWVIAALILTNIGLGWYFDDRKGVGGLVQLHKSIGITVLMLTLVRIVWRLASPPVPLQPQQAPWEKALARLTHWSFYGLMLFMPLTGWAMSSASSHPRPFVLFGVIPWFNLAPLTHLAPDKVHPTHEAFERFHTGVLPWIFYVLFVLHVAGALKHQFLDKDNELGRMIPFLAPRRRIGG